MYIVSLSNVISKKVTKLNEYFPSMKFDLCSYEIYQERVDK